MFYIVFIHLGFTYSLLFYMHVQSLQLCPALWHPTDRNPPSFFIHGISWARTLEWVALPSSSGSSYPRDRTWGSCIAGKFFTFVPPGKLSDLITFSSVQFISVTQSCLTLCDPMNCSIPGLPVHHQPLEFTWTHIHQVGDAIQPSHTLSSPSPPAPNPSQLQSLFQWVNSSHEAAKVLEFQL